MLRCSFQTISRRVFTGWNWPTMTTSEASILHFQPFSTPTSLQAPDSDFHHELHVLPLADGGGGTGVLEDAGFLPLHVGLAARLSRPLVRRPSHRPPAFGELKSGRLPETAGGHVTLPPPAGAKRPAPGHCCVCVRAAI